MADSFSATLALDRRDAALGRARGMVIMVCCTATLFVGSFLLFALEPMVGKMLLPTLGGTPAVWNACLVFFQAVLLAGYGYAHLGTTWLGVRRQARWHLVVLMLPLLVLPISLMDAGVPTRSENPVWWLLARLLLTVGLPFFALSTTAPLVQKWFASTGHAAARDPYFLYAASNAGSLLGLLAYPLLIEPQLALVEQSRVWTFAYLGLMLLTGGCAALLWLSPALRASAPFVDDARTAIAAPATDRPTGKQRLWWIFLSFVPSSLMLGVTTHITTDLATAPLFWVVPLALYLLTFIFAFSRVPWLSTTRVARIAPFLLLPLAAIFFASIPALRNIIIPLHLVVFFLVALICHGRLAEGRPGVDHLTEYYLWISVGGVLGGLFNAIVAPLVFPVVLEYPIVLMLACLAWPPRGTTAILSAVKAARTRDFAWPIVLGVSTMAAAMLLRACGWGDTVAMIVFAFVVPAFVVYSFRSRPLRFALGVGVLLVAGALNLSLRDGQLLHIERNFFGVKQVLMRPDGQFRLLVHGGTIHGSQNTDPALAIEPTAYFHRHGPMGDVFAELGTRPGTPRVGIVGLGAGTLACYAEPGQHFTFYEIDPAMVRVAEDPRYFSFLAGCRGSYDVVLGDGRLTLAAAPRGAYDLLVLDAFSSDSIPTHLLTREALGLYLDKLADGGMFVFHISNRYLSLAPLLANLASERGLVCYDRTDLEITAEDAATGKRASEYVAIGRRPSDLGALSQDPRWRRMLPNRTTPVWTDQYSNVLSVVRWR